MSSIDPPKPAAAPAPPAKGSAPVQPTRNTIPEAAAPKDPAPPAAASEPASWESWINKDAKRLGSDSDATAFIDAVAFYKDLAEVLVAESDTDAIIFLAGWACISDFALSAKGGTLAQIFTACATKGANIRALIWDNFFFPAACQKTVNMINGLKTGAAILDKRTAIVGSHHQKIIGIIKPSNAIAYCGGMDINPDRIKQTIASGPLHDTHVKVQGKAAIELARVIFDRWNDHPSNNGKIALPTMRTTFAFPFQTRIGVTYPRIDGATNTTWASRIAMLKPLVGSQIPEVKNSTIGDMTDKKGDFKGYDFLPPDTGETTVWETILDGIRAATKFIYMEDQYLVSRAASKALAERIRAGVRVVIVCCHPDGGIDIEQVWRRHKDFIDDLSKADPSGTKWTVTYLKGPGDPPPYKLAKNTYVHSKCWIFDDELAIIGSANCTRRSYTMDSEAVVAVHGVARPGEQKQIDSVVIPWPSFAMEFRLALWAKHLVKKQSELIDPIASLAFWFAPAVSSHVAKLDPNQKVDSLKYPALIAGSVWDYFVDPDGQ